MPKIEHGEEEYRIVDGKCEGDCMYYGEPATMEDSSGDLWTALVDLDEDKDQPITKLPGGVWLMNLTDGTKLVEVELEEVNFDDDPADAELGPDEEEEEAEYEDEEEEGEYGDDDEDEIEELKAPEA